MGEHKLQKVIAPKKVNILMHKDECGEIRDYMEKFDIKPGDIVILKKDHPCGTNEWEVLCLGADIRLKCRGCGHCVMLPRSSLNKKIKKFKNILAMEDQI